MFRMILKRGCRFLIVQIFQFEIATQLMFDRTYIRDQLIENSTIVSVDVVLPVAFRVLISD